MIRVLFICHGSILKSPEKASKIKEERNTVYLVSNACIQLFGDSIHPNIKQSHLI